jgi:hypothetical protein
MVGLVVGNVLRQLVFLFILFSGISLFAQKLAYVSPNDALPDAPSNVRSFPPPDIDSSESTTSAHLHTTALIAVAASHPPVRIADKPFWLVNGAHLFWTVADVEITAAGSALIPPVTNTTRWFPGDLRGLCCMLRICL